VNLGFVLGSLFFCVIAGFILGRVRSLAPESLVTVIMDVLMPALVFDALLTAEISLHDMALSAAASSAVIFSLFILCLPASRLMGLPLRSFSLPVLFMNAGFLGIPLMSLAFGPRAVGHIVVFDQVQSLFMFTLGIWIAARPAADGVARSEGAAILIRSSVLAFLREPLIYAIVIATALRAGQIGVPETILRPIRYLGAATPQMALFALGLRLAATPLSLLARPDMIKRLLLIVVLRFAGGLACGYLVVSILSLEGLVRQVVLIASALPSAVFSYILAERYRAEPDLAASAVFVTTVLSIPILPALLKLATVSD